MPVRLTPDKLLLITYDMDSDSWVTLEGVSLCLLAEFVDIEPGVTLEHIFDFIDRNKEVRKFLEEYCSCDIDKIRKAEPKSHDPIQVITGVEWHEGVGTPTGVARVDQLVISPFFYVYTDESTQERRLDGGYMLLGRSSLNETIAKTLGGPNEHAYAELKGFELRLDTQMRVDECDDDKMEEGPDDTIAFSANVRYRLLDVLTTVVEFFGNPAFDPRYQKQIDEDKEFLDRLNEPDEDDPEPAE